MKGPAALGEHKLAHRGEAGSPRRTYMAVEAFRRSAAGGPAAKAEDPGVNGGERGKLIGGDAMRQDRLQGAPI